jgi:CheY-like chemotaxis protein
VSVESPQDQPKVLMLGANPLVRDNVRVLLRSMGYQCLVASARKDALRLLEHEKPDAAILDPHFLDSSPASVVAMFHKRAPGLRGRAIVLLREESDPELLEVLDAYSFPRVRLDALLRELWPSLDSLLRRVLPPRIVTRGAPLVFDSFLEPSFAGMRSLEGGCRQLRYESDTLVADFSLEGQSDSRMTLTGQVLDTAKGEAQVGGVPVVLQGHAGLIGIAKTNEWGEFHFEFEPQPGITLEIRARENLWVSAGLPDLHGVRHRA